VNRAVERARRFVGTGHYVLGGGDYHDAAHDVPYTSLHGFDDACDCWGIVAFAKEQKRHQPGFNRGAWSSVADDVNWDSAIEDAEHAQTKFALVTDAPQEGDLVGYPSIRDGRLRLRIGHGGIISGVSRVRSWNWSLPAFDQLDVIQCQSTCAPAIKETTGALWLFKDTFRGKQDRAWRTRVLRPLF
jgi:hypothetical protein